MTGSDILRCGVSGPAMGPEATNELNEGNQMITKGQQVWIRPEWADPGDNTLERYAAEDESGGRVLVVTIDPQFTYFPTRIERTAHLTTVKP